jgi:uncharacterized protein (DUF952 family)
MANLWVDRGTLAPFLYQPLDVGRVVALEALAQGDDGQIAKPAQGPDRDAKLLGCLGR